jgi:hypothetical protein
MEKCQTDENGEGHVFGSPAGGYMTLICFKNGSLAREKIRELYGIKDWKKFGELARATKPGNDGGILLPWFEAEIVPRVNRPGIHRFDLDEKNAAANCRAIFEAQMMSMRLHSQWMKCRRKNLCDRRRVERPGFAASHGRRDELPRAAHRNFQKRRARRGVAGRARLAGCRRKKPKWENTRRRFHHAGSRAAKSARTKRPRKFTTS